MLSHQKKQKIMKKYEIKKAFSLLEKVLLIEGDQVYAEQKLMMIHVYSPKTRKLLGKAIIIDFENCCTASESPTMKDAWISLTKSYPVTENTVLVSVNGNKIGTAKYGVPNMKCRKPRWFDLSETIWGLEDHISSWQLIIGDKDE